MAKVPRRTIFRPLALMMAMALAIDGLRGHR